MKDQPNYTYVLFFSGPEPTDDENEPTRSARFEIVMKAPSAESATEAVKPYLAQARADAEEWIADFSPGVYLDRILELGEVGEKPQAVGYISESPLVMPDGTVSRTCIGCALPAEGVESYQYYGDEGEEETTHFMLFFDPEVN